MPSSRTAYNDELVEAQRSAVAILHKRMKACEDPVEQCKLAVALLRARPAKDDTLPPPPKVPKHLKSQDGQDTHDAEKDASTRATPTAATPPLPYSDDEYGALVLRYGEDEAAHMNIRREDLIAEFNRTHPHANPANSS